MNNFEGFNKNKESERGEVDYFDTAQEFLSKNNFIEDENHGDDISKDKNYKTYKPKDWSDAGEGQLKEEKSQMLELLQTPEFLKDFFEKEGFENIPSKSIINKGGSTLFMSAGVQILDPIIHNEREIFEEKIYVAQPVFRTQFIPKIDDGVSSSFINIATEMVNKDPEEHFNALDQWMELLKSLGLNRENFILKATERYDKWGKRRFLQKIIKIYYDDLEIGDALYMDMPQDSRNNIFISDIGFGLDRIKWLLSNKSYFKSITSNSEILSDLDNKTIDYTRTLALLAGSGVEPSNKEQGYRLRQLSKLLVKINLGKKINFNDLIKLWYDDWGKWTDFSTSEEYAEKIISTENERNLNREILDILKKDYPDVDLDVNQPTDKMIKCLNGTSVDKKYLKEVLKRYYELNN